MKLAIIIRGPSGSGKSTLTKKLTEYHNGHGHDVTVCSADNFFMKDVKWIDEFGKECSRGEYQFNPAKLGEAHAACLGKFIGAITDKHPVVIVDNTNIKNWEWRNYAMIARAAGYEVEVQEFRVEWVEAIKTVARRNVHRVPADIVYRMCVEFEPCENAVVHQVFPEKTEK
jgi:tRNA uridine 5-carbamoylmethylation protein Kti12